jgi:hypothetical protein
MKLIEHRNIINQNPNAYEMDLKSDRLVKSIINHSRFIVTVNSIAFIERTNTECAVADPRTGQELCFLLNRLTITISIIILDRVSNKSRSFSNSVSESTRIKSRIIGRDIRETEFRSASDNILETMTNNCFKECASKSAKRINKFIKKYG